MKWLPPALLAVMVFIGWSLVTAGVYHLGGQPWAMICASVPFLVFALVLAIGMSRV